LGGRKGIPPVKNEWWGAGMVICLEWCILAYGPGVATATHSLASVKSKDWFYLSGTGSPG